MGLLAKKHALHSDEYSISVHSIRFYTSYEATFVLIAWSESAMVVCKVVDPSLVLRGGCGVESGKILGPF